MTTNSKGTVGLLAGAVLASVTGLGPAVAQGPAIANPSNNWSYSDHASTAGEGYLRGQANVASALGEFNYLTSIAAINRQEAIHRAIENSRIYTKAYYEQKEMRRDYLDKYGPKPLSKDARKRIQDSYVPSRLTETQFDRESNRLYWPHILRQPPYEALRDRVDELFASRTQEESGDGSQNQRSISEAIDGLNRLLSANIEQITPSQFISAKDFLRSAAYEAQQVAVSSPTPKVTEEPPAPLVKATTEITAN